MYRYQIEKFESDWERIQSELSQLGDDFDQNLTGNLDRFSVTGEGIVSMFVQEQLKLTKETKEKELLEMRDAMRAALRQEGGGVVDNNRSTLNHQQVN
jgi:hypothetical protein